MKRIKIGIPLLGSSVWNGGTTYVELIAKAIALINEPSKPVMSLIVTEATIQTLELHHYLIGFFDEIIFVGDLLRQVQVNLNGSSLRVYYFSDYIQLFNHIDFLYPDMQNQLSSFSSASWIPDFQHLRLPEFFQTHESNARTQHFANIAQTAKMIVFSSMNALNDFDTFFKTSAKKRILSFYHLPNKEWYLHNPIDYVKAYHLPDYYFICCNQFWTHKNHIAIFEALSTLKSQGVSIPVVFTGSTHDYRFPNYFEQISHLIKQLNIEDLVFILGHIPRINQIQLMRYASAVIQPSLFEGWSTVVEDARALGKPIFLSDFPVHIEQKPPHAIYFDRNSINNSDLAIKLKENIHLLNSNLNLAHEKFAHYKAESYVSEFALNLIDIAYESIFINS